jgi:hypothetical protein
MILVLKKKNTKKTISQKIKMITNQIEEYQETNEI